MMKSALTTARLPGFGSRTRSVDNAHCAVRSPNFAEKWFKEAVLPLRKWTMEYFIWERIVDQTVAGFDVTLPC
jgi:hypothetical protein